MVPATTGVVHMHEKRDEWIDKMHETREEGLRKEKKGLKRKRGKRRYA